MTSNVSLGDRMKAYEGMGNIPMLPTLHEARKNPSLVYSRADVVRLDMPKLTAVTNRERVLFDGESPSVAAAS